MKKIKKVMALLLATMMIVSCFVGITFTTSAVENVIEISSGKEYELNAAEHATLVDDGYDPMFIDKINGVDMVKNFRHKDFIVYDVNIIEAGFYNFAINYTCMWENMDFTIYVDDVVVGKVTHDASKHVNLNTPVWTNTAQIQLPEGEHSIRITHTSIVYFWGIKINSGTFEPVETDNPSETDKPEEFEKVVADIDIDGEYELNVVEYANWIDDGWSPMYADKVNGVDMLKNFRHKDYVIYHINVLEAGPYDFSLNYSCMWEDHDFTIYVDDVEAGKVTHDDANYTNMNTPVWTNSTRINLTEGEHTIKLTNPSVVYFWGIKIMSTYFPDAYSISGSYTTNIDLVENGNWYDKDLESEQYKEDITVGSSPTGGQIVNNFRYGDVIAFTVDIMAEGTYKLALSHIWTEANNWEISIDRADAIPVTVNASPDSNTVGDADLGEFEFSAGVHTVELTCVQEDGGQNIVGLKFIPVDVSYYPEAYPVSDNAISVIDLVQNGKWYENYLESEIHKGNLLAVNNQMVKDFRYGDVATFAIDVETAGTYKLALSHVWAADSAWKISIDGKEATPVTVSATANWSAVGEAILGEFEFSAGEHTIELTCVQENSGQHIVSLIIAPDSIEYPSVENMTGLELSFTETNKFPHPEGYYFTNKKLEEMPVSYEAWVYIPSEIYDQRIGVIIGNYFEIMDSIDLEHFFAFEISDHGKARLIYGTTVGAYDYVYENAVVPADTWTHVAVVHDESKQSNLCYINGELCEFSSVNKFWEPSVETLNNYLYLASDGNGVNQNGFKGILGDVVMYSDVRTHEEVKKDYRNAPDLNDENLILYYDISEENTKADVEDKSGNGYDMSYYRVWFTEEEMEEIRAEDEHEYAYSIVFLPDTQMLTEKYPDQLESIFDCIIENKTDRNIQYVISLGDLTNGSTLPEWSIVKEQYDRLNGVIPYSILRGNHDTYANDTSMDDNFGKGTPYYDHIKENGGFYDENSVKNTYAVFSVNNIDYMVISLDWLPTKAVMEWVDKVIAEHPDHHVIVTLHSYLHGDGMRSELGDWAYVVEDDLDANMMWEEHFKKHDNIDMVVCGHICSNNILVTPDTGENGNTVYQMLIDVDRTDYDLGGLGMIAFMHFTEDGRHAKIEYYSAVHNKYFYEAHTDISFDFDVKNTTPPVEDTTPPDSESTSPDMNETTTPDSDEETTTPDGATDTTVTPDAETTITPHADTTATPADDTTAAPEEGTAGADATAEETTAAEASGCKASLGAGIAAAALIAAAGAVVLKKKED